MGSLPHNTSEQFLLTKLHNAPATQYGSTPSNNILRNETPKQNPMRQEELVSSKNQKHAQCH
jgi:hypothetical protein